MEDDGPDIRTFIESALKECDDMELLDLIYQLLITSNK